MVELLLVNRLSPSPKLQGKPGAGGKPSPSRLCGRAWQPAWGTNLSVCSSEIIMVNSLRLFKFWGLSHAAWHPDWTVWLLFPSFPFFLILYKRYITSLTLHFHKDPILFSKASDKPKRSGKFVCIYFFSMCLCVSLCACVCLCMSTIWKSTPQTCETNLQLWLHSQYCLGSTIKCHILA